MERTRVRGTLHEMWETRPARPREGRQVAGVAAALARRYDVDPVLIRIGIVVSAFYGVGLALYIAAWLILPGDADGSGRASGPPRLRSLFGLVALTIISVGSVLNSDPGWLLPTAATLGLLFLLHRARSGSGTGARSGAASPDAGSSPAGAADVPAVEPQPPSPPAWDPLGAAPFAWDLPDPAPQPEPPARRPFPVTKVTLALALLAVGVSGAVMLALGGLSPSSIAVLCAAVLGVIALGLLVGSFLHTGHGLIPAAVVVGLLTWVVIIMPLDGWPDGPVGEMRVRPLSLATLQPSYSQSVGAGTVDLRQLDLAVGPDGDGSPVHVAVALGAGDLQVFLPPDADVTFTGEIGMGNISYAGTGESGSGARLAVTDDLGLDGVRDGRPLVIDVRANMGSVEVRRG